VGAEPIRVLVLEEAREGLRKLQARQSTVHLKTSFLGGSRNQGPPGHLVCTGLTVYGRAAVAGSGLEPRTRWLQAPILHMPPQQEKGTL
jgi:hypothetical protein